MSAAEPKDRIVVIGSGTGGICCAARVLRQNDKLKVTILDKAEKHYYQPGFTLVGAGIFDFAKTERSTSSIIPHGASWVKSNVKEVNPSENAVVMEDGRKIPYDYLVVAAGIDTHWDKIPGLKETLGKNGVCSNYSGGINTWEVVKNFKNGQTAIFTNRAPVKCGGAPIKAMFLSWDIWTRKGLDLSTIHIKYMTPSPAMFPVKKYCAVIDKICEERKVERHLEHSLTAIDGPNQVATFSSPQGEKKLKFDMLHVTPVMSAPAFVKNGTGSIANKEGWVEVDNATLQHKRFPNIFALGDCSSLPTSKTAAAICRQAPVLVHNLLSHRQNKPMKARYDGYTSCPLVTGIGSLLLMEFGYDLKLMESLPWDQGVHDGIRGRIHYWIKKYVFPPAYWEGMLKGRWYGPTGPFPPLSMFIN